MAIQWSWYVNGNRRQPEPGEVAPAETPPTVPDEMLQRIIKLIPVEVIGAYTAAEAFAKT